MDPSVWGPPYWFVLHSVAMNYPVHPTNMEKRNVYRLIEAFHEFIPIASMAKTFQQLVRANPVVPYLDTRADLVKWMHHIHNVVNRRVGKPPMDMADHLEEYARLHDPPPVRLARWWKRSYQVVYTSLIMMVMMYGYLRLQGSK